MLNKIPVNSLVRLNKIDFDDYKFEIPSISNNKKVIFSTYDYKKDYYKKDYFFKYTLEQAKKFHGNKPVVCILYDNDEDYINVVLEVSSYKKENKKCER